MRGSSLGFTIMALGWILGSLVDPFNIVNELNITFHILSPRAHGVFAKLLFGYHMFELLANAFLHRL